MTSEEWGADEAKAARKRRRAAKVARQVEVLEREAKLLHRLAQGDTLLEAGAAVGVNNASNARRMRDRAFRRITEQDGREVLAVELAKLDVMERSCWPYITKTSSKTGLPVASTDHIDRVLRIMAQRAKYLGLESLVSADPSVDARRALVGLMDSLSEFVATGGADDDEPVDEPVDDGA